MVMKRALVFLLLGVASLSAQALPPPPATPTPVIIDTDVGTDLDDAMALGIAFRAQQMGYLRIKAITTSNSLDKAPSFVHTMITYAGYTLAQIPIGAYKGVNFCSGEGDNYAAQTTVALGLVPNASRATFPDALTVLRATLAAAADSSVVIITLGGHGNIAALMQSPADGISPATGAQLWNQKVLRLVAQGGGQPPSAATTSYTSPSWGYNYHCDGAASAYMLSHNGNVPIILNPIEAGILVG